MPEEMSLTVNGESKVPPGFRFHPTEEELLQYYLRKKVAYETIDLDVIREVDLNKLEPWDIQEKCRIGSGPQNEWYFFSHKDKKYPTGTRTNRATAAGFWKATGRDKVIRSNHSRIGMRKTLVFYKGRAPHGQKSDWIMHEYRLEHCVLTAMPSDSVQENGWVVCRVFKKKNYPKTFDCFKASNNSAHLGTSHMYNYGPNDSILDRILSNMRTNRKENKETTLGGNHGTKPSGMDGFTDRFVMLLNPDSVPPLNLSSAFDRRSVEDAYLTDCPEENGAAITNQRTPEGRAVNDWVAFDQLVASQLNGLPEAEEGNLDFHVASEETPIDLPREDTSGGDPWTFYPSSSSSSSDPLFHFSA